MINPMYLSMNILAHDKVLYDGHAIAAVAATSPAYRRGSAAPHRSRIRGSASRDDVDAAMKPGATILLKDLRNKEEGDKHTNVAQH